MSLVETNWLEKNIDNVKIIDCSWHMPQTKRNGFVEYNEEHIPNAIFFDLDKNSKLDTNLPHMLTDVEKCEKSKEKAYNINVKIPKILKNVAKKHSIKFVHLSTDHIFNGKKKGYYSENNKADPLNYYSKTKFLADNFTKDYKKALIVRTNFFGGYTKNKKSFSELILDKIRKKNSIKLWDDIYFTPVNIFFLIKTIERLIDKNVFGIINISSSDSVSKYCFGIKLCKYLKLDKKYILKKKQNKNTILRPKNMSLSNNKICKIFPDLKKKLSLDYQIKNIYNYSDNR